MVPDEFDLRRLRPFWTSTIMDGENLLFVKEGDLALAPLPAGSRILCSTPGELRRLKQDNPNSSR